MLRSAIRAATMVFVVGCAVSVAGAAGQKSNDEKLEDRIEYRLETNKLLKKYDIKVKVDAGNVMLHGDVATEAQKAEAGRVAKIDGVVAVNNMLDVDTDVDKTLADRAKKGLNKMGDKVTDAWLTTKVIWHITGDDVLQGSDINVDTSNNVVTLKGTVRTAAARAHAEMVAKDVDGVKRVVNELKIVEK